MKVTGTSIGGCACSRRDANQCSFPLFLIWRGGVHMSGSQTSWASTRRKIAGVCLRTSRLCALKCALPFISLIIGSKS
ncbi:hypothetical protein V5799_017299 [Amblyomma americanum]|uniref:Uncharacterized protein n=1 Tax=Amblyomma americanum TaxID=6943 RepID=A0AAQ4F2I1_AMBAM